MPNRNLALAATVLEVGILLAGLVLAWRLALSPAARRQPVPDRLPPWPITVRDFFFFVWLPFSGIVIASACSGWFLQGKFFDADVKAAITVVASQLGMMAGILIFKRLFDRPSSESIPPRTGFVKAGITTFLIAMPVVALVGVCWQSLLQLLGMPEERQDLIRMFLEAKSPVFVAVMVILACVGAPVTEELIFRGGFFRYCRTRMPRWAALLLPACLFAAMHELNLSVFAPLVALGVIFSLAYERTGSIGTSIVAHALFNLNSIIVIYAGVQF